MAKTQPDRIASKRQLSLWGIVEWRLTNFLNYYYFPGTLNIYSRYFGEERLTKIPRSE